MNFLAHLYLSKENTEIIIGNFIADGVKGKKHLNFPQGIRTGIIHHRAIDSFTDQHPIVQKSKRRLHKRYGHYKGIIIDIFYDHFLAKNWQKYSQIPLDIYVQGVYHLFQKHHKILPEQMKYLLPYMIDQNWLYSYRTLEGIEKTLFGMNKRTQNKSQMNLAIEDLKQSYSEFENDFIDFFENLITFSNEKLNTLQHA